MNYRVVYDTDGSPVKISFAPRLCSSSGGYDSKLGTAALQNIPLPNWEFNGRELTCELWEGFPNQPLDQFVKDAQSQVYTIMDKLVDLRIGLQVLKEAAKDSQS